MPKAQLGLVALALSLAALSPAFGPAAEACAATSGRHAALVVDTGERELGFCVALDAPRVSGIRLIELAGRQFGLSYRFGYQGQAVCMLAGVGPGPGEECFADAPSFWGFWIGDGDGGWTWARTGAGAADVSDGDMHGWTWGRGNDGSSHPAPPAVSFTAVCSEASRERPATAARAGGSARPGAPRGGRDSEVGGRRPGRAPVVEESGSRRARTRPAGRSRVGESPGRDTRGPAAGAPARALARRAGLGERAWAVGARPPERRTAARASPERGGPPPSAVLALVCAALLGGAGALFSMGRRGRPER